MFMYMNGESGTYSARLILSSSGASPAGSAAASPAVPSADHIVTHSPVMPVGYRMAKRVYRSQKTG